MSLSFSLPFCLSKITYTHTHTHTRGVLLLGTKPLLPAFRNDKGDWFRKSQKLWKLSQKMDQVQGRLATKCYQKTKKGDHLSLKPSFPVSQKRKGIGHT